MTRYIVTVAVTNHYVVTLDHTDADDAADAVAEAIERTTDAKSWQSVTLVGSGVTAVTVQVQPDPAP